MPTKFFASQKRSRDWGAMRRDLLEDFAICCDLREQLAQRRGEALMDYPDGNVSTEVLEIRSGRNPKTLAEVKAELRFGGHVVTIDNAKVLQGSRGPWLALPSYSVQIGVRGDYRYYPAIVLSPALLTQLEDVVLKAYEEWAKAIPAISR